MGSICYLENTHSMDKKPHGASYMGQTKHLSGNLNIPASSLARAHTVSPLGKTLNCLNIVTIKQRIFLKKKRENSEKDVKALS